MGSGHITKNRINLELIEIIQFFLKICDESMGGSMGSSQVKSLKIK